MMPGVESGAEARDELRRQGKLFEEGPPGNRIMSRSTSKMVAALHAQIAERDQRIAELEARNAELERYAYTVSHDLKTPLVTIKGFISFLSRDVRAGDQERIEHDLERIGYAADRMRRLLDDLLELARVGRVDDKPRQMAFAEVVDEALERLADDVERRDVEILIADALPTVYGDKSLLVDVLEKLLENAVKHSGEQPAPCIEIGARRSRPERRSRGGPAERPPEGGSTEIVLFVRDNGPGIHPRYQEQVFGLFERLEPDASDGTGVGLTLVKRIVEFHGGRIWIESSGRGTTMCWGGSRWNAKGRAKIPA